MCDAIRAVLFDMDGVVADTQASVTAFWQDVAKAHGVVLSPRDFHRHVYGLPASHTLDVLFAHLHDRGRADALALMYDREVAGPYREIPGAIHLLQALRAHGIPRALVTSAEPPKVAAVFRALNLDGLFDAIVTRDDIERGKPDPEGYLVAAAWLAVDPTRCLVLEDALSGVEAAIAAGAICIGVTASELGGPLLAAGVAAVVPDLEAITIECLSGRPTLMASQKSFGLSTDHAAHQL